MENILKNKDGEKASFSFKKEERLTSKKVIDKLFLEGDSFLVFPLKVVYSRTALPSKYPVQAAFSVGKRNFKQAVKRNLIKRKMREAYRLNKFKLYNVLPEKQVAVFFLFIGKKIPGYLQIEVAMEKGIQKLIAELTSEK